MSEPKTDIEEQKTKITEQIAALSGLLGMIPSDGSIDIYEPVTHHSMTLENWFSTTRAAFLRLSLSISETLDIQLQ